MPEHSQHLLERVRPQHPLLSASRTIFRHSAQALKRCAFHGRSSSPGVAARNQAEPARMLDPGNQGTPQHVREKDGACFSTRDERLEFRGLSLKELRKEKARQRQRSRQFRFQPLTWTELVDCRHLREARRQRVREVQYITEKLDELAPSQERRSRQTTDADIEAVAQSMSSTELSDFLRMSRNDQKPVLSRAPGLSQIGSGTTSHSHTSRT